MTATIQRKDHLDPIAISLLLACCALWGFQQVLVKATLAEIPPTFQAGLRFSGATVFLWLWCLWRKIPLWQRDGTLLPGLLTGAFFALEFFCVFSGMQYSSASRLTVFVYTAPLWVALILPWIVKSERLSAVQWLGLVFAFGAVALTLREGFLQELTPLQHWGDLLGVGGAISWAITTIVIRTTAMAKASAEKMLFYQVGVSSLALLLFSYFSNEVWQWNFSAFALTSLLIQASAGAFASYLAWMWLLGRYPATKIGTFAFLTPVFALIFGSLWLGEAVTLSLLGALAMVGVGIALVNKRKSA